ncbi:cytochrome c class I [Paenibacillus piri]|uniref:Cytochrome c class I n=1 Tax=Paenibacillus piri TaxID=2547395 RepID=A0A4R5KD20_9BACL|nr:cytochrome c class I [Paenibacillus piri]TDF92772.1 cytochrome c class I [Paenibacillus piri]
MGNHAWLRTESPVPNDLGLAIPGNLPMFEVIIVVGFILHILFVNLLVAGSVSAVYLEIKGIVKKDRIYDSMANRLATQVSTFKSIAVVLGIAPLLIISTIYTQFFYPSTILIGHMWLMMIPLLIIAFLSLYVYKFTWEVWRNRKGIHLIFGLLGTGILLFIPLLFITNVASMLQPELWDVSRGFWGSLFHYPTIWQRYMHFMGASFTMTGIFMYWRGGRALRHAHDPVAEASRLFGKRLAAVFTLLQLAAGPLLLLSMDARVKNAFTGGSIFHTGLLVLAILLAIALSCMLVRLTKADSRRLFMSTVVLFLIVLSLMSWIRHEVRELYLAPYVKESPRTIEKSRP